jgi:poly-gamma-glutamate capsule biosynthesis protein CapA/YwtB (metallophosphatase superfamily)
MDMATQDESTETGVGVGPQTPAARQRAQRACDGDPGTEPEQSDERGAAPDVGAEPAPGGESGAGSDVGAEPGPGVASDLGAEPAPGVEPGPTPDVGAEPGPGVEPGVASDVSAEPAPGVEPGPTPDAGAELATIEESAYPKATRVAATNPAPPAPAKELAQPTGTDEPAGPIDPDEPVSSALTDAPEQPAPADEPEQPAATDAPEQPAPADEPDHPAPADAPAQPASAEGRPQPPLTGEPAPPASAEERAQRSFASAMERARRGSVPPMEWPPPRRSSTRERVGFAPSAPRRRDGFARASTWTRDRLHPRSTRKQAEFAPLSTRERVGLAPSSTRERLAALVALGSGVGVLLFLLASLGSSGSPAPGLAGLEVTASSRVVAPGGWIALVGSGAPHDAKVVLETRSQDGAWRSAGSVSSDEQGDFRVRGRALATPGPLEVRARVPGAGASGPIGMTVRPLRLASVGDINLGDAPGAAIAANGPRYPWTSVRNPLRNADIAFGNLECAVSERGEPFPKQFTFRGTPAALRGLRRQSGIDVLNLANNHVGDYGTEAMLDTVRHVEALGMRAVGAGRNLRRALAPQVVERLGLRIAFVGFSQIAPLEFAAGDRTPGTAWATPESIVDAVRAARRQADVVVATFHWGIEKAPFETADQRTLAQTAAAAGAHLVIGAHPHVLQPMRREGAAVVAYSLGNFVFGAASSDTTSTGILEADLTADGVSAARWRPGRIVAGRPVLDGTKPRRLPLRDPEAMETGVSL